MPACFFVWRHIMHELTINEQVVSFSKKTSFAVFVRKRPFCFYLCFVVVLVEPYMRKGEHCCHSAVAICWRYDGRFSLFWSSIWFLWAKVLSILMQCTGGRFIYYSIGIYLYWYLRLRFKCNDLFQSTGARYLIQKVNCQMYNGLQLLSNFSSVNLM